MVRLTEFESATFEVGVQRSIQSHWHMSIPNGDVCKEGEIIGILRIIKGIHWEIEKVYAIYQHENKNVK